MNKKLKTNSELDNKTIQKVISQFNGSGIGVVVIDKVGQIKSTNEQWKLQMSLVGQEVEGKTLNDFFILQDQKTFKDYLKTYQIKRESLNSPFETLKLHSNNQKELLVKTYIKRCSDSTDHFLVLFRNMDETVVKEMNIINMFSNINENLSEGIYRGIPNYGLIYVNQSFVKLLGYTNESEVTFKNVKNFYVNKEDAQNVFDKLKEDGIVKNATVSFRKKDGTTFWGLINCTLTSNENGALYYDGVVIDITEKRKGEELLKAKNNELKKINAQMDRFLYSASHDIRSPMTSIMGLVNILRMEIDQNKHVYLDKIDASLKKLDYFIKEVMQFSQNSRTQIQSDKIDFNDLIQSAWEKVKGPLIDVEFIVKISPEKYYFYSDYNRILIVLINIFKNSIQYIDYHKSEQLIEVNVNVETDQVTIEVTDNGIGIGEKHLENVFDMFYRGNDKIHGPGMGLFIVKETLARIKGDVSITSQLYSGTSVITIIPNGSKGKLMAKKMSMSSR